MTTTSEIEDRYGPWAVVTGASSGIGQAFAQHLASEGVNLVLAARSEERLRAVGQTLTAAYGVENRVVTVDLAQQSGARTLAAATEDLDVGLLVSNAGDGVPKDFLDHHLDELQRQVVLNATSHLELIHHFGRRLVERGAGGILITSASAGFHGLPHMANLAAAKGYLHHLGEALHHELAAAGVDVTVLLPGSVDTPIVGRIGLEASDLPVRLMAPQAAVAEAMQALTSGRATIVPGRVIRVALRVTPRRVLVRLNGRLMERALARNAAAVSEPAA